MTTAWAWAVEPKSWRDNTSHSSELKNASAAALSKHDPTRPIDWRIPSFQHNVVNASAVYVLPRSELSGIPLNTDRGVQYRALRYTQALDEADAVASVGSRGDSFDNAMAEALNSLYKAELIYLDGPWNTHQEVEAGTAE